MAIDRLQIPYDDFVLHEVIEPDEFDLNNKFIVDKVNEIRRVINQITDSIESGGSGADIISLTPIEDFASDKLQAFLEEVIAQLKSTSSESGASFIGSNAITGVNGTTVQTQLESLKQLLDAHRTALNTRDAELQSQINNVQSQVTSNDTDIASLNTRLSTHNHDTRYMTRAELTPYLEGGYVAIKKDSFVITSINEEDNTFAYTINNKALVGMIDEEGKFVFPLESTYTVGINPVMAIINDTYYLSTDNGGVVESDGKHVAISFELSVGDVITLNYYAKTGSSSEYGVIYGEEQPLPTNTGIMWFKPDEDGNVEIRPKEDGSYGNVLHPKTNVSAVEGAISEDDFAYHKSKEEENAHFARSIQIEDENDNFESTDVESAMAEIITKTSDSFGDGAIKTKDGKVHFFPDSVILNDAIRPSGTEASIELENAYLDGDDVKLETDISTPLDITKYDVEHTSSHSVTHSSSIAIPFIAENEANIIDVKLVAMRLASTGLSIWVLKELPNSAPSLSQNNIGSVNISYSELSNADFTDVVGQVNLRESLSVGETYFICVGSHHTDRAVQIRYANTPTEENWYGHNSNYSTWTPQERTPYMKVSGYTFASNASITFGFEAFAESFQKHSQFDFDFFNLASSEINSNVQMDILDSEDAIYLNNVERGIELIQYNLGREYKFKISISRTYGEELVINNFLHTWVEKIQPHTVTSAVMPGNNVFVSSPPDTTYMANMPLSNSEQKAFSFDVTYGGSYILELEMRHNHTTGTTSFTVYSYGSSPSSGISVGGGSTSETSTSTWTKIIVNLRSVPPNSTLFVYARANVSNRWAYFRNIKLKGQFGYIEGEVYD